MAFNVDKNGDITLIQGDSGTLVVNGLNPNENYSVYLAVRDRKRNLIGRELYINSYNSPSISFELTPDFTNLLKVDKNEPFAIYNYAIKICLPEINFEDTLLIGNKEIGMDNLIIVYPQKVEGV